MGSSYKSRGANDAAKTEEGADGWSRERLLRATARIPIPFYRRPATLVAQDLLSCIVVHGDTAGMIVETEAYLGMDDLAAHAARGKTERTKVLFGPPGRAYVYFIYGMHECLNVVAERVGEAGCVLIRALEPLCGIEIMRGRRRWSGRVEGLANGPGKLTQALAISRANYGQRLDTGGLTIRQWMEKPTFQMATTPRVGITKCADWPLRFLWKGHPCVSKPRVE